MPGDIIARGPSRSAIAAGYAGVSVFDIAKRTAGPVIASAIIVVVIWIRCLGILMKRLLLSNVKREGMGYLEHAAGYCAASSDRTGRRGPRSQPHMSGLRTT
jgi:hypothetical protein